MQTLFVANHVRIRFQRPDCEQKHLLYRWEATISLPGQFLTSMKVTDILVCTYTPLISVMDHQNIEHLA